MDAEALTSLMFKPETHDAKWIYLILILVAISFFIYFWIHHKKSLHQPAKLKILEQKHISAKSHIYLVDYEGQQFLLAENPQALSWHPLKTMENA